MQKRSEAAKDTEIVGDLKPKSREKSRKSVLTYILALAIVVILFVLLSFAMSERNREVEAHTGESNINAYVTDTSRQQSAAEKTEYIF